MCSSGPCLQNIHHNNVAVNGGGGEFGIQRRDTRVEIQVKRKHGKVQWMIQVLSDGFKHSSMPRLLTNESPILTHIQIFQLISSKLHTVKSHIHYESLLQHRIKECWGWKLYAITVWMHSETSSHSGQRNEDWMPTCSCRELRCTEDWMVTIEFIHCRLHPRLTRTLDCNLRGCHCITRAFRSHSLRTAFMMRIGSHNLFPDTRYGGPNLHLVIIELGLHSKHWELNHLWVSVVYGWAGVASHLVESLSRICLLRFLLSSCSPFDRAR
jgi:hypothetical protein